MANKYINKAFDLSTTGATTIYTVPAETVAIVKAIQGFNDTASAVTITMSFTDASASTTYDIGYASSSTVQQFSLLTDSLLVLEESDVLKLTASAGTQVTGVASILEQDRN
jgi:hypothetical protein|tara:strand:+ start:650 stop:982 length:333 start_codon:yes stop_codon:yes gene_type:complete